MNIDFHVHGLLSKRKDFNEKFFLNEIKYAKRNSIDGIILCEHFNAISFKIIYNYLEENYIYEGGTAVYVTFKAKEGTSGQTKVSLDSEGLTLTDASFESVEGAKINPGTITIA